MIKYLPNQLTPYPKSLISKSLHLKSNLVVYDDIVYLPTNDHNLFIPLSLAELAASVTKGIDDKRSLN